jgi:hypothetical protein
VVSVPSHLRSRLHSLVVVVLVQNEDRHPFVFLGIVLNFVLTFFQYDKNNNRRVVLDLNSTVVDKV